MKTYDIYFHIKANNTSYSNKIQIEAKTAKEAKDKCVPLVMQKTGKHAFHVSTKPHGDYGTSPAWPMED